MRFIARFSASRLLNLSILFPLLSPFLAATGKADITIGQARARLKHYAKNPGILKDYGIGENITVSRAVLEQYALAIHQKTATDKLSKVTAAKRQELFDPLDAYKKSQTAQGTGQSTASQLRGSHDNLLKTTVAQRMKIQFPADAEWPHTTPSACNSSYPQIVRSWGNYGKS